MKKTKHSLFFANKTTKIIFLYTLLIFSISLYAQNEGNIWYFGWKAGLDFNSGSPVTITNGKLWTDEGCATMSDDAGNLLFYTDGDTVWNSEHVIMPNGIGLAGCWSSSQGVIILPYPNLPGFYYIFTVDCFENSLSNGLQYSIVQMSLNGGTGDVSLKNVPLASMVTEKITAVKHANGSDYWIITHEWGTNTFFVHLLNGSGINILPQTYSIGSNHGGPSPYTGTSGSMNVSHDGTKLAAVINSQHLIEIYDFDNSTGAISNPLTFPPNLPDPYGVEFSPDNSRIYVANNSGTIYQINLLAGSPADIINSLILVGTNTGGIGGMIGTLQIGTDGKIYIACSFETTLAVIDNPNSLGLSCNFIDNYLDLNNRYCSFGLPQSFYDPLLVNFFTANQCFSDSTSFTIQDNTSNGIDSVLWSFDDPLSGLSNFSKLLNPKHLFSTSGSFDVVLVYYSAGIVDTINKVVHISDNPNVDLGNDITICFYNTVTLYANNPGCDFLWSTGAITDSIICSTISDTIITYSVTVTNNYGCIGIDSINIIFDPCASIDELSQVPTINIFPNPSNGKFKIQILKLETDVEMHIMNIHGQLLRKENFVISSSSFMKEIDLSMLPKGIYFINFRNENFVKTEKLVIR